MGLPLSQDDRNNLVDTKENTQDLNTQIEESSVTISSDIAKLLLVDTPFKKYLDPIHADIFSYEEELRRLDGTSILQPLQELAFYIGNTSGNPSRLYLNDGRLIITENGSDIVNVPLYPVRGYSRSLPAGKDFDIWSRDRFGSSTSIKHINTIFTIDDTHRKLKVRFDGSLEVEIDVSEIISIIQEDETIFAVTTGEETSATLSIFPITPGTDVLTLISGELTTQLIRGTDYTINYITGEITFLTSIPDDNELLASYHNEVQIEASAIASTIQLLLQQADALLQNAACIFNASIQTFTIVSNYGGPTATVEVINASTYDMRLMLGFTTQFMITGKYQNNLLNVEIDGEEAEIKITDLRCCFEDSNLGYNNDDIGFDWSGSLSKQLGYEGYNRLGPMFCSGFNNGKDVARSIEAQLRMVGSGGFKDASVKYYTDSETFIIYSGTMGLASSVHVKNASDPLRDVRSLIGFVTPVVTPAEERGNEEFYDTLEKLYDMLDMLKTISNISVFSLSDASKGMLSHSLLYTISGLLPSKPDGINLNSDFQDFSMMTTKIYDDGSRGLPRLFPNGKAVVDSTNDKINFTIIPNVEVTANIPWGTYNESDLADAVDNALESADISCSYDSQTKRYTISRGSSFVLLWGTGEHATKSIANYLGFQTIDLSGASHEGSQVSFQMIDFYNPVFCSQFYGLPKAKNYSVDELSALLKEREFLNYENKVNCYLNYLKNMYISGIYDNEVVLEAWEYLANLEYAKVTQEFQAIRFHRGAYANHISETDANVIQKTIAYNNLKPNFYNLGDNVAHHAAILNITYDENTFNVLDGGNESLIVSTSKKIYYKPAPDVRYESSPTQVQGYFSPYSLMTNSIAFTPEPIPAFKISADPGTKGYSYSTQDTSYDILTYSDTSASILSSNSGPYNMSAGNSLLLSIDGNSIQTITFNAISGYTESRVVSNGFVIRAGFNDKIDFSESTTFSITITQGAYTGASLATEIQTRLNSIGAINIYTVEYNTLYADRFVISGSAWNFSLLWSTGVNASTSARFVLGFDPADVSGSSLYYSDNSVIFPVQTNINDTFSISIDGILNLSPLIIPQGNYNLTTIIDSISSVISNDPAFSPSDFNVTNVSSKIRITSTTMGNFSTVQVYEGGITDFLRTVALDGDVPVYGGSDVNDISAVTVGEVSLILNTKMPPNSIIATPESNKVRITTCSSLGSVSTIQITGGTCRTIIGFDTVTTSGVDSDNKLKVVIDGDATKDPISLSTSTTSIYGEDVANNITSLLQPMFSGSYCSYNEVTVFQTFTNSLRIVSGTYGITSTVYVSDRTIKINSSNNILFFEEISGVAQIASLTLGFYSPIELAIEIKTKLDLAGANTYTVTYSLITNKMTITSSGLFFSLLFSLPTSVCTVLGFYKTSHMSSTSYTSDGEVKWGSCHQELGFSSQTIEPGHTIDSVILNIIKPITIPITAMFTVMIYWSDNGGGNRLDLNIDLTAAPTDTITGLIQDILTHENYQTSSDYSPAFLISRIPGPYRIEDEDVLTVLANGNLVPQEVVFSAKKAQIISSANPVTRVNSGTFTITINGSLPPVVVPPDPPIPPTYPGYEVIVDVGEQLTAQSIAERIQQQVRSNYSSDIQMQSALSLFECAYEDGTYKLSSGTGGTRSSIQINDTSTSQVLGIAGLYDFVTTGDVVNSCFVSASEIISKLSTVTGITPSIAYTHYVKLTSTISNETSKIELGGSLADKLGFFVSDGNDGPVNNIAVPFIDFNTAKSVSLKSVSNLEIKSPEVEQLYLGWDSSKGDVSFSYYTIDDIKINERLSILTNRLPFITSTRESQIMTRASDILNNGLTEELYESRKPKVTMRLNKKTGPYIKVGDKFSQQENNQSIKETNDEFIANINTILGIP